MSSVLFEFIGEVVRDISFVTGRLAIIAARGTPADLEFSEYMRNMIANRSTPWEERLYTVRGCLRGFERGVQERPDRDKWLIGDLKPAVAADPADAKPAEVFEDNVLEFRSPGSEPRRTAAPGEG
jgi:hypothetical protein